MANNPSKSDSVFDFSHDFGKIEIEVDGKDMTCMVLDITELDGKRYAMVHTFELEENMILHYSEANGQAELSSIDNDQEYARAFAAFKGELLDSLSPSEASTAFEEFSNTYNELSQRLSQISDEISANSAEALSTFKNTLSLLNHEIQQRYEDMLVLARKCGTLWEEQGTLTKSKEALGKFSKLFAQAGMLFENIAEN